MRKNKKVFALALTIIIVGGFPIWGALYLTGRANTFAAENLRRDSECRIAGKRTLELHRHEWRISEKSSLYGFSTYNPKTKKCFVTIVGDVIEQNAIVLTKKIYDTSEDRMVLWCTWDARDETKVYCVDAVTGQRTTAREDALRLETRYLIL